MTFAVLDERLSVAPFVPVTIHLANGRFFHIDHPDFVILLRLDNALAVHFAPGRVAYVDVGSITTVETTEANASV
jgi:hypothetical protein